MKKILLSCACCLLALGLVTACDDEVEEPEEPEVPGTVVDEGGETTYLLGVEVDGVLSYIDGGTVEGYAYEGTLTTDVSKAAAISCESSGSTYYLSFDNSGVTNWVTIAQVVSESDQKTHTNLVYATEKSALYLHTTDGGAEYFGNEDGSYFLCYNSAYKCFYASSITGTPSNSNVPYIQSSPVAGLYTTDGKLVAGGVGEEPAPAIEPVIGTVTEGQYFLGVTMGEVNYYFDGTLSGYYGSVSPNGYDAAVVTVAAATDGYTLSIGEGDATQYLYAYVYNGYVDLGLQAEPFTWQYDTTFETFVVELNDQWNFIGTYGTNQRLGMNDYGYLTGDKSTSNAQYPAKLFEVITYNVPTAVTITGAESVTSLEEGETLQLSATVTGTDPVNGKITWTSSDETVATVSSTGLVSAKTPADSVTITATSAVNPEATDTVSLTITEMLTGPIVASNWQETYTEEGKTFKLGGEKEGNTAYIDGYVESATPDDESTTTNNYYYEGTVALNFDTGVDISLSLVGGNEYYMTFEKGGDTYYISFNSSSKMHYTTTAESIFWDSTKEVWVDNASSPTQFLSYYSYDYIAASAYTGVDSYIHAQLYEWKGEREESFTQVNCDAVTSQFTGKTWADASIKGETTTHDGFTIAWGGTADTKPWPTINSSGGWRPNIRIYNGATATVTPLSGYKITRVVLEATHYSSDNAVSKLSYTSGTAGEIVSVNNGSCVEVTMNDDAQSLVITSSGTVYLAYMTVYYTAA